MLLLRPPRSLTHFFLTRNKNQPIHSSVQSLNDLIWFDLLVCFCFFWDIFFLFPEMHFVCLCHANVCFFFHLQIGFNVWKLCVNSVEEKKFIWTFSRSVSHTRTHARLFFNSKARIIQKKLCHSKWIVFLWFL